MGIAYFEKGQHVSIDHVLYELDREVESGIWQLVKIDSGMFITKTLNGLLQLYASGVLKFVVEPLGGEKLLDNGKKTKTIPALDLLPEKLRKMAIVRRAYVHMIRKLGLNVFTKASLEPVIEEVGGKLDGQIVKPHWITVYRWWKRYEKSGYDIRALVDRNHAKGNRVRRYSEDFLFIIESAIETIFLTRERKTIQDTLDHAISRIKRENDERLESDQLPLPTWRSIKSSINALPKFDKFAARHGRQAAVHKFRSVLKHVITERPLQRVEIDHTQMDMFVVDDESMLPLGRPWLTICIDDFSRCILGISLDFIPPSHLSVARCLKHAMLPKTDLQDQYPELKNTWESHGVMEVLVVDNGLEFHGHGLEALCYSFGSEIQFCPRKKAWFKGKIERLQGTLNRGVAHGVPGTTFHNIFEKADDDAAKMATVTLSTLQEIVRLWIVDYYHQKPHTTLGMSPAQAWSENSTGIQIPYPADIDDLDALMGRIDARTVTHKGVEKHGLLYNSPELNDVRMEIGSKFKATIRNDDGDLGHIHVIHPVTETPIRVPALNQSYAKGLSLWQHCVIKEYKKNNLPNRQGIEALVEAKERIRELVLRDFYRKKTRSRSKLARLMSVTESHTDNKISLAPEKVRNSSGNKVQQAATVDEKINTRDETSIEVTDGDVEKCVTARRKLGSSIEKRSGWQSMVQEVNSER